VSSANLEIVFEGPAVQAGTIDAQLLAESLLGYSEVFTRANAVLNGEGSQAAVLVQSEFKHGSFIAGLEFAQNIIVDAQRLFSHPLIDASGLVSIIGFVWKRREIIGTVLDLLKRLQGEKPKEVTKVDGNSVNLKMGDNNNIVVNNIAFQLSQDSAIAEGFRRVTSPLRRADIDRIIIREDDKQQVTIEKQEAGYFEGEPLALQAESSPLEGKDETVLIVSKLSFVEGTTWSFIQNGSTLTAKIEDSEFWANVHKNNLRFGEGDRLRVVLHWKIVKTRSGKLVPRNTILKVYEVMAQPVQLFLNDGKDKTGVPPEPKGRKFR
jgi:hypothetical protein